MSDPTVAGHDIALVRRSIQLSADEGDAAGLQGIAESLCVEVEQRHRVAAAGRDADLALLRRAIADRDVARAEEHRLLVERNDYARRLADMRDERDAARSDARQVADDHADALSDARAEVARVERERDDLAHAKWGLERLLRKTIRERDEAAGLVGAGFIRARVADGMPWWRHRCGNVIAFEEYVLAEARCGGCEPGSPELAAWQPLYTPVAATDIGATEPRANETAGSVASPVAPLRPHQTIKEPTP